MYKRQLLTRHPPITPARAGNTPARRPGAFQPPRTRVRQDTQRRRPHLLSPASPSHRHERPWKTPHQQHFLPAHPFLTRHPPIPAQITPARGKTYPTESPCAWQPPPQRAQRRRPHHQPLQRATQAPETPLTAHPDGLHTASLSRNCSTSFGRTDKRARIWGRNHQRRERGERVTSRSHEQILSRYYGPSQAFCI